MKKTKSETIVLKYIAKAFISTALSIVVYSLAFSYIIFKADLSMETAKICSIIIALLCSATVSFVSVYNLKNSGALAGMLCQLPFIVYSLINVIFNNNSWIMFFIKILVVLLTGALIGIIITNKNKRTKI